MTIQLKNHKKFKFLDNHMFCITSGKKNCVIIKVFSPEHHNTKLFSTHLTAQARTRSCIHFSQTNDHGLKKNVLNTIST